MDITPNEFAAQFSSGQPEERHRRQKVTKRELVAQVKPTIEKFRRDGFSWEGIAAYFASLGVPLSVTTLKSYTRQSRKSRNGKRTSSDR